MMRLGELGRTLRDKILSERASPDFIARGWALGMFVGCFVPFGLQLLVSVPLSFAMKCSKIGATVGTLITNPFTILFIYPAQTWVGSRLIGHALSWGYLEEACGKLARVSLFTSEGWQILGEVGGRVLAGYFVGGLLLALLLTPLTYVCVRHLVVANRRLIGRLNARPKTN